MALLAKLNTYRRLGLKNLIYVALYRLKIKRGTFQKILPIDHTFTHDKSAFFSTQPSRYLPEIVQPLTLLAFGWIDLPTNIIPNWLKAVDSDKTVANNHSHWSQLNDFDLNIGDIKTVWELSRFHWLFTHAVNFLADNDQQHIAQLNEWLCDWSEKNPINQGVNWKCGQEASIRVMHLAATAFILNQEKSISHKLARFIYAHLCRIAPTVHYAMAQDNNHGTSEAAALYIGSVLLEKTVFYEKNNVVKQWKKTGKYWLENRAQYLISDDGAFSQHSANYHRLMLDTLSLVEFFRQQFEQAHFSENYRKKVNMAINWLATVTCSSTGKPAILGLNDGAQLIPLTTCGYLDFRPSIQWASLLFDHKNNPDFLIEHQQVAQLKTLLPPQLKPNACKQSTTEKNSSKAVKPLTLNSSYHAIQHQNTQCIIRTPNVRFRPSSSDILHIDFSVNEENILIGTGSYSYNCEPSLQAYFTSVKSHNTVQFDDTEQIPKLSRFLYNHWVKVSVLAVTPNTISAEYTNYLNHQHRRTLELEQETLTIVDNISGFSNSATARLHLPLNDWALLTIENEKRYTLSSELAVIEVSANVAITKIALVDGYQSRYYLKKEKIAVLEVTLSQPGCIQTTLNWS